MAQNIAVARDKLAKGLGVAKDPKMRAGVELAIKDYDLLIAKIQGLLRAQSKCIVGKAANVVQDLNANFGELRANQSNLNTEYSRLQSTATQQEIEISNLKREIKTISGDNKDLQEALRQSREETDDAHIKILGLEDQLERS